MVHGRLAVPLLLLGLAAMSRAEAPQAAAARIDALIAQMTLEEKLGQLTQQWGGLSQDINPGARQQALADLLGMARAGVIGSYLGATGAEHTNTLQRAAVEESRLKIPLLFGNDIIHGYRTVFPIPLAEAATWNPTLIEQACRVAAVEGRAAGTHWTFAPMIDVCRDPRWGRIAETAGEDHFLGAQFAAARVRGFQGENLAAPDAMLACGKHFVAYGAAEGGRDYNTVDVSPQTLHEVHLSTFRAAVDAGVGSIMSAFNEINGIPATANPHMLQTMLRGQMGFSGLVVSDWGSINEMIAHGYAADPGQAALQAIRAGVDMDMCSGAYRSQLAERVTRGELDVKVVDAAVRRVLEAKQRLGLFDNPYTDPKRETQVMLTAQHRALARDVARRSIVLLKNENGLLPLKKEPGRIALIGPLADAAKDMLGTWSLYGKPEEVVTLLAGLRNTLGPNAKLGVSKGSDVQASLAGGIDDAVKLARESDIVILAVGESEDMSGEGHCRANIEIPQPQQMLIDAVCATGKPVVLVLFNGRPMALQWAADHVPAMLVAWQGGVEAGNAVADVLFGDFNPSGRLPATFPRVTGQVPIHYNHRNTGRPAREGDRYTSKYIDLPPTPLYPFGFGLSYTSFRYAEATVSPTEATADGKFSLSVVVTNTGARAGEELVQAYYRDPVASMTRPVRQLCGFERVSLAPGESKRVTIEIPAQRLGFYDWDAKFLVEPGVIQFFLGPHSAEGLQVDAQIK
ncbi:MAG: glycoside hydrolase family 3 N-terminal domain-containing protein [Phycisphaerae bacterium]|nr:glycoside hydrolase family 3 N-terminal domain-containing protein [Phycisphaerae bacterium]